MDARERAQQALLNLERLTLIALTKPAARRIYKLKQKEPFTGQALSVQTRLELAFREKDGREFLDPKNHGGGVFLDVVPQAPALNEKGFPEGDWDNPAGVTAKLGVPDVSKLIAVYEAVRYRTGEVPLGLRDRRKPEPNVFSTFHNSAAGGGEGNLSITWSFTDDGSDLRLAKSAQHAQRIALTLDEEVIFVDYLRGALRGFNTFGY